MGLNTSKVIKDITGDSQDDTKTRDILNALCALGKSREDVAVANATACTNSIYAPVSSVLFKKQKILCNATDDCCDIVDNMKECLGNLVTGQMMDGMVDLVKEGLMACMNSASSQIAWHNNYAMIATESASLMRIDVDMHNFEMNSMLCLSMPIKRVTTITMVVSSIKTYEMSMNDLRSIVAVKYCASSMDCQNRIMEALMAAWKLDRCPGQPTEADLAEYRKVFMPSKYEAELAMRKSKGQWKRMESHPTRQIPSLANEMELRRMLSSSSSRGAMSGSKGMRDMWCSNRSSAGKPCTECKNCQVALRDLGCQSRMNGVNCMECRSCMIGARDMGCQGRKNGQNCGECLSCMAMACLGDLQCLNRMEGLNCMECLNCQTGMEAMCGDMKSGMGSRKGMMRGNKSMNGMGLMTGYRSSKGGTSMNGMEMHGAENMAMKDGAMSKDGIMMGMAGRKRMMMQRMMLQRMGQHGMEEMPMDCSIAIVCPLAKPVTMEWAREMCGLMMAMLPSDNIIRCCGMPTNLGGSCITFDFMCTEMEKFPIAVKFMESVVLPKLNTCGKLAQSCNSFCLEFAMPSSRMMSMMDMQTRMMMLSMMDHRSMSLMSPAMMSSENGMQMNGMSKEMMVGNGMSRDMMMGNGMSMNGMSRDMMMGNGMPMQNGIQMNGMSKEMRMGSGLSMQNGMMTEGMTINFDNCVIENRDTASPCYFYNDDGQMMMRLERNSIGMLNGPVNCLSPNEHMQLRACNAMHQPPKECTLYLDVQREMVAGKKSIKSMTMSWTEDNMERCIVYDSMSNGMI